MGSGSCHIGAAAPEQINNIIGAGLDRHSAALSAPAYQPAPFCLVLTDADGQTIGGLSGQILWQWLHLELLWVDEAHRGHGHGRALLAQAEQELLARQVHGIYLWTQSWQAPSFYEACGFTRAVTLPDFPQGHDRIGFYKRLGTPGS